MLCCMSWMSLWHGMRRRLKTSATRRERTSAATWCCVSRMLWHPILLAAQCILCWTLEGRRLLLPSLLLWASTMTCRRSAQRRLRRWRRCNSDLVRWRSIKNDLHASRTTLDELDIHLRRKWRQIWQWLMMLHGVRADCGLSALGRRSVSPSPKKCKFHPRSAPGDL